MPELSAEKKLQQLLISNKFEKITSNTFNVEISQLEILKPFFYKLEYYDVIYRPTKNCVELFDEFEKYQAFNFSHSMKIISNNIYQKFDELNHYCLEFDFDIEPLKFEFHQIHEKYINKMLVEDFYYVCNESYIKDTIQLIINTLKLINIIVYLLKNNYNESYKFGHCNHLFNYSTHLLITKIGKIPICEQCEQSLEKLKFEIYPFTFERFIEIKPIEKYYKIKLI